MLGPSLAATAPSTGKAEVSSPRIVSEVPPFRFVYESYFAFVWRSARRLGVGAHAIDDVVQEVFITIHARLHTLIDPSALRSWIYGVVRRIAATHLRQHRARAEAPLKAEDLTSALSLGPTPLDVAELTDRVKLLWSLLEELDDLKREVFVLVEVEEMAMPEVAQALDIPLGTVYSRVRAARIAFEAALVRRGARSKRGGNS